MSAKPQDALYLAASRAIFNRRDHVSAVPHEGPTPHHPSHSLRKLLEITPSLGARVNITKFQYHGADHEASRSA
jgi:hypothetical protein